MNTQPEKLYLKSGEERRLKTGHPWIFSNELKQVPVHLPAGSLVEVFSAGGDSFGLGFFNPHSLISVRLLWAQSLPDPRAFLTERISDALALRNRLFPDEEAIRVVFGESDFLPGLVVDKYGDYLSVQFLSAGMELWKEDVVHVLKTVLPGTKGIVEKNRSASRLLEGLDQREGVLDGEVPEVVTISESGIRYDLSLTDGQKTGYFLDQKLNRLAIHSVSAGSRVLDCFCNQGGFALHASQAGAAVVTGVDLSEEAIRRATQNARVNNLNAAFVQADVFRYLQEAGTRKEQWDVIILDPPGFAKSKKHVPAAKKGYLEINRQALRLIPQGGFLVTSSCSQHIFEETFLDIIHDASRQTGRHLRQIFRGQQAPDHPILESMSETRYLKFFIFQVF
ncbi:MAG: class I SAM-dependent rRNA methyltransferase [Bacteroidetes bacterium]|nr:class I SAM-dependent rRNA methyltransferase [Bacteroidota bacterium]